MNFIKNILGRVFAFWAVIIFVSTLIAVFFPMAFLGLWKEPKRSHLIHHVFRTWMSFFFFMSGIRLKVRGQENFKKGENYIITFNHNSMMDVPVSTPFTPGANKTIAKIEMSKIPIFGMVYKRGSVLVDRKNEESRKLVYVKMKEILGMGLHMVIYPEGTRNKTSEPLQRFHDGAFRLSFDTGKSISPAIIFNSAKVLPRKTFFLWPEKIDLHFLEPISPRSFSSAEKLKTHVFEIMKEYYTSHIH
ncbi:MAG TPA: 1-acyl-sn-glycerol-3-phosphate acyltransferase [Chitinophagaceae bacterium]|nr:1-acyl-sn-glycerol-3-phosphate acyltransferase [Chitinophagaceae bacterium]